MEPFDTTEDRFLSGEVTLIQPQRPFHRAGSDAVFLASTVNNVSGKALDMGAGCGAVGLLAAHRNPGLSVDLAENDPVQLECARRSVAANPILAERTRVIEVDLLGTEAHRTQAGLARQSYDVIVSNPPYRSRDRVRTQSARISAHTISQGQADQWMRCAAALLKPGGLFTMIFASDGLEMVLTLLSARFGDVRILGLHPRASAPAERLLISGRKGRRTPTSILPGLIVHEDDGAYSSDAEAILAGRSSINLST